MRQYMQVKEQHADCLVLFRMGDFYETFYKDAEVIARDLDIVLTKRGKGAKQAPLAGIPYHALDGYLAKLIRKGHKVCIVEQLEDPKKAKGVVKRGVVRIVTPGTVIEDSLLQEGSNNYLLALTEDRGSYGMAFADVSVGDFLVAGLGDKARLLAEVEKLQPAEVLLPLSMKESSLAEELARRGYLVHGHDDRFFLSENAERLLRKQYDVLSTEGFGLKGDDAALGSAGALLAYLQDTQLNELSHLKAPRRYQVEDYMMLDAATQRNLELLRNIRDNTSRGTVFDILNRTSTAMGSRKLKRWLLRPLLSQESIEARHDAIEELKENALLREEVKELISDVADVERIMGKVSYGTCMPRDLLSLKQSLEVLPGLKKHLSKCSSRLLKEVAEVEPFTDLAEMIGAGIKQDPAATVREGNIIKDGHSKELDELREVAFSGKSWIAKMEDRERDRTGIKSLKIRYNKVFGYFIEVTKANVRLVPDDYVRKQTQVNAERYITEELKQKEDLILGAQEKIHALEYELFMDILKDVGKHTAELQRIGQYLASLDCLVGLAIVALERGYCRPTVTQEDSLKIVNGRHPVVESLEPRFVPNDCVLDVENLVHIITGPNMSGKSTYLRQVALITLMAQMGSFVPAASASIGIVDRIFSRVGAYDDLSMGQSTFMVEMNETANILNNATERSLVIMDEIGRGTSTYDGFSLAWAIAEYLCTRIKAKTLFATHYHQLNKMAEQYPGIKNFHIEVKEEEDITFLHSIRQGGTDKSYGIQVAKLAGLPESVIDEARTIMKTVEGQDTLLAMLEKQGQDVSDRTMERQPKKKPTKEKNGQKTLLEL